ncbi:MAG: DUF6443 domain-containing protein [Bacteroides cellulosilyticus]
MEQIVYYDGLGRPVETVDKGVTPDSKDLVSLQEYDQFGRDSYSWLPAKSSGNGGYVDVASVKVAPGNYQVEILGLTRC